MDTMLDVTEAETLKRCGARVFFTPAGDGPSPGIKVPCGEPIEQRAGEGCAQRLMGEDGAWAPCEELAGALIHQLERVDPDWPPHRFQPQWQHTAGDLGHEAVPAGGE